MISIDFDDYHRNNKVCKRVGNRSAEAQEEWKRSCAKTKQEPSLIARFTTNLVAHISPPHIARAAVLIAAFARMLWSRVAFGTWRVGCDVYPTCHSDRCGLANG